MAQIRWRHLPAGAWFLGAGLALSAVLTWFALDQYLTALVLAGENLRGVALSITAAAETLSGRDPSFSVLEELHGNEIAYLAVIDRRGTVIFHTNGNLIGKTVDDGRFKGVFNREGFSGDRVVLGTGEEVYESNAPIHVRGITLDLRLALHTYRADGVIRRARTGVVVLLSLMAATWVMAILLYRASRREERQRREIARREQLARMGEMGAVIAHEIRNPLAGIKGYAQLIQEKLSDGENREAAGLVVSEAVRLEEMVNDLLAYARQEKGEFSPVDVEAIINGALEVVRPEAVAANVSIDASMAPSLAIEGNRDRLHQLFLNLFRNAIQAMPAGGELRIDARRAGSMVEIEVSDSGQGIAERDMGRLFEPFFTTRARGAGLGLAVCKKIVEEHGATITVDSRPGAGSSFLLVFPVQAMKRK